MPVDLCFHPTDHDACTARAQAVPDHSGVCFHPTDDDDVAARAQPVPDHSGVCFHPGEADTAIHELLTATDAEALRFLASAT
jgi:hypothetical protein